MLFRSSRMPDRVVKGRFELGSRYNPSDLRPQLLERRIPIGIEQILTTGLAMEFTSADEIRAAIEKL